MNEKETSTVGFKIQGQRISYRHRFAGIALLTSSKKELDTSSMKGNTF